LKIICIGRNYVSHIKEFKNKPPKSPVIFIKPDTSIIKKNQPFFIPSFSNFIDHELEMIVKINRIGKHIQKEFSHKYYQEISLGIDFTARKLQDQLKKDGLPWEKSKSFDGSALIGKWISKDNFKDLNSINFELFKNKKSVQKENTSRMIWDIDSIISYCSIYFTLKIGDIIFTGTPKGVSNVQKNDILEGFIEDNEVFYLKIK
jgi:2-keto-4-pentenoate hydratase/2-oxohepta-3-ene-1,7-dioic acid hydratase in catechol pathway